MGFLRRLIGGRDRTATQPEPAAGSSPAIDADEREREADVIREDEERLDELARRQLRYADYAWTPPAEGGTQRADDADASAERC
jgi:hypothetical protein